MSLNVTGLNAYTDEHKMGLIKKSILEGRTINYVTVQPDIKSSASINIIDSTLVAAAGSCGWNAAGETALTQRDITVCPIKVNEAICLDTLESYYTQKMMNAGSYNTDIPFEQIYAEEKAGKINAMIEDVMWKGDEGEAGNLALCNGFLYLLEDEKASTVAGNVDSVTGLTAGNIIDVIDGVISVVPSDIIDADDLVIPLRWKRR